jgi:hypothetical protein
MKGIHVEGTGDAAASRDGYISAREPERMPRCCPEETVPGAKLFSEPPMPREEEPERPGLLGRRPCPEDRSAMNGVRVFGVASDEERPRNSSTLLALGPAVAAVDAGWLSLDRRECAILDIPRGFDVSMQTKPNEKTI